MEYPLRSYDDHLDNEELLIGNCYADELMQTTNSRRSFFSLVGFRESSAEDMATFSYIMDEARAGRDRLCSTRNSLIDHLKDDLTVQQPFTTDQISEAAFARESRTIYDTASNRTKTIYDALGLLMPGLDFWAIRWALGRAVEFVPDAYNDEELCSDRTIPDLDDRAFSRAPRQPTSIAASSRLLGLASTSLERFLTDVELEPFDSSIAGEQPSGDSDFTSNRRLDAPSRSVTKPSALEHPNAILIPNASSETPDREARRFHVILSCGCPVDNASQAWPATIDPRAVALDAARCTNKGSDRTPTSRERSILSDLQPKSVSSVPTRTHIRDDVCKSGKSSTSASRAGFEHDPAGNVTSIWTGRMQPSPLSELAIPVFSAAATLTKVDFWWPLLYHLRSNLMVRWFMRNLASWPLHDFVGC